MAEGWAFIPTKRGHSHSRHYMRAGKSYCGIWRAKDIPLFKDIRTADPLNCAQCQRLLLRREKREVV